MFRVQLIYRVILNSFFFLLSIIYQVFSNTIQLRSQVEGSEAEAEERTNSSATKRSVELKSLDIKIKRSDSLTKDEKTECNTKAREREQRGVHNGRSKRFFQRGESGLKRRHTVGGTRDFDKVSFIFI